MELLFESSTFFSEECMVLQFPSTIQSSVQTDRSYDDPRFSNKRTANEEVTGGYEIWKGGGEREIGTEEEKRNIDILSSSLSPFSISFPLHPTCSSQTSFMYVCLRTRHSVYFTILMLICCPSRSLTFLLNSKQFQLNHKLF